MISALAAAASPSPQPVPLLVPDKIPCYQRNGSSLCKRVYDWTGSDWIAQSSDWLIVRPARILTIFLFAVLLKKLAHRTIDRLCAKAAAASVTGLMPFTRSGHNHESSLASERREQRAATMASVLRSIATGVVYSIALLMSLSELRLNIGPLLASAGILGVAIGFGSQSLVKDFLSGIFMILEDQYGVGDQVDMGFASGVVESVGLRVTRVRDVDGTVWYVRNGDIARVGNKSQGWARIVVDVEVAHGEDMAAIRAGLTAAGRELMAGPHAKKLLEEPVIFGVQDLKPDGMVVRVGVRTQPAARFVVGRAFRELIANSLKTAAVAVGSSNNTLWVRADGSRGERSVTVSQEEQLDGATDSGGTRAGN